MARPLSIDRQEELFLAYQFKRSVLFVARTCRVSATTVKKYRKQNNWEERLQKIQQKAAENLDKLQTKRLQKNLGIVERAKNVYASALVGIAKFECKFCHKENTVPVPNIKPFFSDIDKLLRLEEYLLEGADLPEMEPKVVKFSIKPPPVPKKKEK